MATSLDAGTLTVAAATTLEAQALRKAAPAANIVHTGMGLSKIRGDALGETVIICGLAGGLRDDLATGSIVIPDRIQTPAGNSVSCDSELVQALMSAAEELGYKPYCLPLITMQRLVLGPERALWAQRGYAAADMETGLINARRLATVRVILDTPQQEISPAWSRPATALIQPQMWPQALWLWREAPRCARLAAAVLSRALR